MDNVQSEEITKADALRFLRGAIPIAHCRLCGADELEPITEHDGVNTSQVHMRSRGGGFFPTVAFVCGRCGDVTQIAWPAVKSWLAKVESAAHG
jgi:hypothetical protein